MADEHAERRATWGDLFVKTVEIGLGAAMLTVETAQKVVDDLVRRGQVSQEERAGLVDRLIDMGHQQRVQFKEMIDRASEQTMSRMDVARRSDLDALRKRVAELEQVVLGHTVTDFGCYSQFPQKYYIVIKIIMEAAGTAEMAREFYSKGFPSERN